MTATTRLAALLALAAPPILAGCSDPTPVAKPELRSVETALHAEAAFAGAIALAKEDLGGIDEAEARRRVDALSVAVGKEVRLARNSRETAEAIARVFFGAENYMEDPADPEGRKLESYDVSRLLARRKGACLPMAIVIARAAQGAGLIAGVVRTPGHALVVVGPPRDRAYLDPGARGLVRSWLEVTRERPWSPQAGHVFDGRPLRAEETLALYRSSRAAIRLAAGKLAEAEADARAALAASPDLPEALVNLAAALLTRKDEDALEEADERLERARLLLPRSAAVLYNSGLLAAARGETAEALRYFDAALQVDPGHEAARANRAALEGKR